MNHNLLKNLFTALALMAATNLTAADWVRKKAPIMSEWGEKINPDKVMDRISASANGTQRVDVAQRPLGLLQEEVGRP